MVRVASRDGRPLGSSFVIITHPHHVRMFALLLLVLCTGAAHVAAPGDIAWRSVDGTDSRSTLELRLDRVREVLCLHYSFMARATGCARAHYYYN